jgi:hypothetical protein
VNWVWIDRYSRHLSQPRTEVRGSLAQPPHPAQQGASTSHPVATSALDPMVFVLEMKALHRKQVGVARRRDRRWLVRTFFLIRGSLRLARITSAVHYKALCVLIRCITQFYNFCQNRCKLSELSGQL